MDAAARSFAELGFADSTMEGIAARAGTSIGSVYQFFPNKKAVFRQVAERCLLEARQGYESLVGPDPIAAGWAETLGRVIRGFRSLHARSVAMQAVWRNLELYGEYAEADQALLRELTVATAGLLQFWGPGIAADHRRVIAGTLVNAVATMLLVLAREPDPIRGDAVVAETQRMLECYLRSYL